MHSSANNHDVSTSILSLREIVGIITVFSFVLYLLFPKDNIDQIIEAKGKNTNLSINYLESMLLYYPDNIKLKMLLMRNYRYGHKKQKALGLINELLVEVKEKELLKQLYKTQYFLLKSLYFETDNEELLKEVKQKLYDYFDFTTGNRDYTFFFAETTQIDFKALKYVSLRGFLKERPDLASYVFEKDAFFQAFSLGFTKDAYGYLLHLLDYEEVEERIEIYALSVLLEHHDYKRVERVATKLFLNGNKREEQLNYFNIALRAIISQNQENYKEQIGNLIHLYQTNIALESSDILFLLKSLLQIGDVKGASQFSLNAFNNNRDKFDENVTDMAVKSLIYHQELASALKLSLFAKEKFPSMKWLDKSIQLSLWQGKTRKVVALNIEGYRKYKNLKYEHYILTNSTLNNAYGILGEIYREKVGKKQYSFVEKLSEYYDYTGEIPKAEKYFTTLLKRVKHKQIHKEAILFSYKNSHYTKGLELYESFKEIYGMDKELQEKSVQKLIALKRYTEAYAFAQKLKENKRLNDLGWMQKDYISMYKRLERSEKKGSLDLYNYDKLIKLDKALNEGKQQVYLYTKLWKKSKNRAYLTALFYIHLEKQNLTEIKNLLATLSKKDKDFFEKNVQYQIAIANYFVKNKEIKLAMKSFKTALSLNEKDASTHEAYLWFLLDNNLIKALKKELMHLRKSPKLQKKVGFPSVVTALKLQQSDLALRWLRPLLKASSNIEYQVVYADLLELQDRKEGAKKIRLKLFKMLNKQIKKSPNLLKDKAFARIYLGLTLRYKTPYEKRVRYFKSFKSLFSKSEFIEMQLGQYTYSGNGNMVRYLAHKHQMHMPWLTLYLAMTFDENLKKQQLLKKHKDILAFRDRVMASLDIGDRAGAYSLAFQGLEDNSRDSELFRIYNDMVNGDYPKAKFSSKYKHLTPTLSLIEHKASYRWNIYKGIESEFSWSHYGYKNKGNSNITEDSLSLSLKNSHKKLLWNFSLAKHHSKDNFISALLDLNYRSSEFEVALKSIYQNKTTQTPLLQIEGMESGFEFNVRKVLTQRIQMGLKYKNSHYKHQNGREIGSSEQLQLSADYLLRTGYPDMRFNVYVGQNHYDEVVIDKALLPKDFIEIGSQFSIGTGSKNTIHNSWRPFATVGMAMNNHQDVGTSLSLGLSASLRGEDSLSIMLDYSKGIDAIAEPYYGVSLDYRF